MASIIARVSASLVLSAAVLSGPAFAATPAEQAPTAIVHYQDLNLASEAGARILQRRLARAATAVCPDFDPNDIGKSSAIRACRATALETAQAQAEVALAKARDGKAYAANSTTAQAPGL
jgi:UrcA family protein